MERKIFDKKYVYFMWDDSLKDKIGFVSDDIYSLQCFVENNTKAGCRRIFGVEHDDTSYPFTVSIDKEHNAIFRFVYYDPLYDVKWAWKHGKQVQCRVPSETWLDTSAPDWDNTSLEFRVKPEPTYRPFKSIQELKSTFLNLPPSSITPANVEPMIWVRSKSNTSSTYMITHFCENVGVVYLCGYLNTSLEQLFDDYTFLDGTPIGVACDE